MTHSTPPPNMPPARLDWLALLGGGLLTLTWFMTVIDGLWGYLFKGLLHVKPPSLSLMLMGAMALLTFRAAWGRLRLLDENNALKIAGAVFVCYMVMASMIQVNMMRSHLAQVWFVYFVLFLYYLLQIISPLYRETIPEKPAFRLLLLIAVIMAAIGVAQHFSGNLFSFGRYIVSSIGSTNTTMSGNVRGSAFFSHSDDLGMFLCFAGAATIAKFVFSEGKLQKSLLLAIYAILLFGCYATLTRAAYITFAMGSLICYCSSRYANNDSKRALPLSLPILLMAAALALFYFRYALEFIITNVDSLHQYRYLASSESLDERLRIIYHYADQLHFHGLTGWLFGLGWAFRSSPHAMEPVDNGFLSLLISVGIIGGMVFIALIAATWKSILDKHAKSKSPLMQAAITFYAMSLLLFVFGSYFQPQIYLFFALLCHTSAIKKADSSA